MKGSLHIRIRRRGTEHEHSSTTEATNTEQCWNGSQTVRCPVFPMNALLSNFLMLSKVMMLKLLVEETKMLISDTKLVVARLQALTP